MIHARRRFKQLCGIRSPQTHRCKRRVDLRRQLRVYRRRAGPDVDRILELRQMLARIRLRAFTVQAFAPRHRRQNRPVLWMIMPDRHTQRIQRLLYLIRNANQPLRPLSISAARERNGCALLRLVPNSTAAAYSQSVNTTRFSFSARTRTLSRKRPVSTGHSAFASAQTVFAAASSSRAASSAHRTRSASKFSPQRSIASPSLPDDALQLRRYVIRPFLHRNASPLRHFQIDANAVARLNPTAGWQ